MRKTTTFAAALALAQNAPHIALEILGTVKQQNYMTVRNLKVVALAQLGRCDDVLPVLRSVIEVHDLAQNKHTFCKDVLVVVKNIIEQSGDKEVLEKFERIEKILIENQLVSDTVSRVLLSSTVTLSLFLLNLIILLSSSHCILY